MIDFDSFLFETVDVETNECLDNNGGCWQDKATNITACKVLGHSLLIFVLWLLVFNISFMLLQDTFRGRVCECPVVNGVQFKGDGYSSCVGTSTRSSCFFIICILLDSLLEDVE